MERIWKTTIDYIYIYVYIYGWFSENLSTNVIFQPLDWKPTINFIYSGNIFFKTLLWTVIDEINNIHIDSSLVKKMNFIPYYLFITPYYSYWSSTDVLKSGTIKRFIGIQIQLEFFSCDENSSGLLVIDGQ